MRNRKGRSFGHDRIFLGPLLLAILAATMFLMGTRWGIGVSPDSVGYMYDANPGIHAPLYAWLLTSVDRIGIDAAVGAKWLNCFVLIANVLLVWFVLHRSTRSAMASFLAAFLVLSSMQVLDIHGKAMSDSLFVLCAFLGLLLLSKYLETKRPTFLLISAVTIALAFLTRYTGAPVILAGSISILVLSHETTKRRLTDAFIFASISSTPMVLYMVYNTVVHGSSRTGRDMAFLGDNIPERLAGGVIQLERLLLPNMVPETIRLALLILIVGSVVYLFIICNRASRGHEERKTDYQEFDRLPHILGIFIACYSLFHVLVVFIQPFMPIVPRFVVPIYVTLVPMLGLLVYKAVSLSRNARWVLVSLTLLAVGLALSNSARAVKWVASHYRDGSGYASPVWRTSGLVSYIEGLDASIIVYSNGRDAIRFLTGRETSNIPSKVDFITGKPKPQYANELRKLSKRLKTKKTVLVYFDAITWRWYLPSEQELVSELSLYPLATFADGRVYSFAN